MHYKFIAKSSFLSSLHSEKAKQSALIVISTFIKVSHLLFPKYAIHKEGYNIYIIVILVLIVIPLITIKCILFIGFSLQTYLLIKFTGIVWEILQ